MGRATRLLVVVLLVMSCASRAVSQVAPDAHWRTLRTAHFRIHFEDRLETVAWRAAGRAEAAWDALGSLTRRPDEPVDLILSDDEDFANGFASAFPSNRIYIYVQPPVSNIALAYQRDWLELVIAHELTHIFQLDRTSRVGSALRAAFGRVPVAWPFFPEVLTPGWTKEGLAVEYETRLTGAGRNAGTFHDMILRTALLEGRFSGIDRASSPDPLWPEGNHAYAYGSLFMDYLRRRFGAEATTRLVDRTASSVFPPSLTFDRVGRRAYGESFTALWRDWHGALAGTYAAQADSLRAEGLTPDRPLTAAGRYAGHPRVSPDGAVVAYVASTGRDDPETRLLDAAGGETRVLARRNDDGLDLGVVSWLPDGSGLISSGFQFQGPNRLYQDLWLLGRDGGRQRLTRGARLSEPDVAPDGHQVIAVRSGQGTNELVVFELHTRTVRTLVPPQRGVEWTLPRWSPDGRWIAASTWSEGGAYDIVVLDTTGAVRLRLARDRAVDRDAAWSPDGSWLFFSSDRSGIPNLYAAYVGAALLRAAPSDPAEDSVPLWQVTNVLGGAFEPDVSPDARTIWFSAYHADGYHIERVPFDPATWRPAAPISPKFTIARPSMLPAPSDVPARVRIGGPPVVRSAHLASAVAATRDSAAAADSARAYSPWATLRPFYWLPVITSGTATGTAFGAATSGEDVVGRHAYVAHAVVAPRTGRFEGELTYRFAGLGTPLLGLTASQQWDIDGFARLDDTTTAPILGREDEVDVYATFLRQRWRSAFALVTGLEGIAGHRVLRADSVRLRDDLVPIRRYGAFVRVLASNARGHDFSISRERGFTAELQARWRRDANHGLPLAEDYAELRGRLTAYRDFRIAGFADHVIAARLSGLLRDGDSAPRMDLGGVSGSAIGLGLGFGAVGGSRLLPVRGYESGARTGTRAWTASVEYRLPLALVARGLGLLPAFLQTLSASAFVDAGNAWCTAAQEELGPCNRQLAIGSRGDPLIGVGGEFAGDLAVLFSATLRLRAGVGWPLTGPEAAGPRAYLTVGPSF